MRTKERLLLIIIFICQCYIYTTAQVAINIDGSIADPSAILDVKSHDRGFLLPRLANVDSILVPVAGLMVFDSSFSCLR